MANVIEITDLAAPELAVYTQLTHAQLRSRRAPEKGLFIAESAKVIACALAAGCRPVSFLMERRQLPALEHSMLEPYGDVPVYTADRAVLARLTAGEMETLLRRLAGEGTSPAPAAVNRDFDQGRFQALKEG